MTVIVTLNAPATVDDQPVVTMREWGLMQLACGTQHLVGVIDETGKGRVSSAVDAFDRTAMAGTMRSGRVYRLLGPPAPVDGPWRLVWAGWTLRCSDGARDPTATAT